MPTYALVLAGVVRNLVDHSTSATAQATLAGSVAVDVGVQRITIGDLYDGTNFTAGPPPTPRFPVESLNNLFGGKVTNAELTSLGIAIQTDQQLRVIWDLFAGHRITTAEFLDALVLKSLMTSVRRDQFRV